MTKESQAEETVFGGPFPPLPSWTDAPAVTSYIVTIAGFVLGALAMFHIGLPSNTPSLVQGLATAAGYVVAGVAQMINLIMHRNSVTAIHVAMINRKP